MGVWWALRPAGWKLNVFISLVVQRCLTTEIRRKIYNGGGGPEVKFYLNRVLGSGFLPTHSPGGRESNVPPFPAAPSPPDRHHDSVPLSPWVLPQARGLPSHHQAPPGRIVINDNNKIVISQLTLSLMSQKRKQKKLTPNINTFVS